MSKADEILERINAAYETKQVIFKKVKEKRVTVSFQMSAAGYESIKLYCKKNNLLVSEFIRLAINKYYIENKDRTML